MTYLEWLRSFLRYEPHTEYLMIRKTFFLKNYNDINWYFIYYIILMLGKILKKVYLKKGEHHLYLHNSEDIKIILYFLKNNIVCQYKLLMDICCIDNMQRKKQKNQKRFEISYNLLSIKYGSRLFVHYEVNEFIPVYSVTQIYKSANWYEREIWDMFGIFFKNHKDLRRILTDYGFDGFPLRKDFPQTGYVELRFNNELKHLVYEPLELSQDFRAFDFISPWNQLK